MNETQTKFVMCPPEYLSTRISNNVYMNKRKVNIPRAMAQYRRAKRIFESYGVPILEITPQPNCQDQVYTANVGIAIKPYIILANYKAPGRECEEKPAREFFESLEYEVIQPPTYFEGEADLKHFKDNIYFGGWGLFSDKRTYDWIEEKTGVHIIRLHEINKKAYHLDCSLLVIDNDTIMVGRTGIDKYSMKNIEQVANVVLVPDELAIAGCTNAVKIPQRRIFCSGMFYPESRLFRRAMDWMNAKMDNLNCGVIYCDVDQFELSGADLSCSVFHLDF